MKSKEDIELEDLPKSPGGSSATLYLSEAEKDILHRQIQAPESHVGFFGVYRYASRWDISILVVSSACAIIGGAALPLFTASILIYIVSGQTTYAHFHHELTKYVVYFVYLAIGEFATIYLATVGFIYTGDHIVQQIRVEYLRAVLRQNIAFFDTLGAGEITTRITADTNLIQDGISEKVGLALTGLSTFVTAFIIAYIKSWKLALICSATLVALLLIMGGCSTAMLGFNKRALDSQGQGASLAEDILDSIRTVVAFDAQETLATKYEKHLKDAERPGMRAQMIFALMVGALICVMYLNYGLGFWMGSRFLTDAGSHVNAGDVLTILMAIILGSYNLGNIAPNTQALSTAVAAATKLYSTIDRQSPLDPSLDNGMTLDHVLGNIVLQSIRHVYPSRPEVIVAHDLSVDIPAGKTTAFVGPSGSGKSTIIGLIERFYSPVAGNIQLDGNDIASLNLRWLRQQMSLVSQEPRLFAATIAENIRVGLIGSEHEHEPPQQIQKRIEDAARMANAHDFIMALPDGYATNIGGFSLSGGQKQRIAIARAIVKDPKILLLDEATSALDTKSEGLVQAALDKASQGRTTVVIAHRLSTIKEAHNIVVLSNGAIVEGGSHDCLMDRKGVYYGMVKAQQIKKRLTRMSQMAPSPMQTFSLDLDYPTADDVSEYEHEHQDDASDVGIKTGERLQPHTSRLSVSALPVHLHKAKDVSYSLWTLFKFLASFNRPEWPLLGLGLCASVLAGGIQPSQAVLFAKAISTLSLPPWEYPKLRHDASFWSLMFLMIGLVTFLLYAFQGSLFAYCSEKMVYRARSQAFRVMLHQDIPFFDEPENTTGALTATLSAETKQLAGISGVTLGTLLIVSVNLIASLGVALVMGWKLALVCISAVPVLLLCGFIRVWMLDRFQRRAKAAYQQSASSACEAASAIRTVASLTMERQVLESYQTQLQHQLKKDILPIVKSSLLYASSQALPFLCMALGFWYGGTLLGHGEYSLFQFYVCFSEVIFGAQAAGTVFSHAPDMGKAKHAAGEFKRLFSGETMKSQSGPSAQNSQPDMRGLIEFRDVSFRYPSRIDQPVLRRLDLTVHPGQFVALVGPSGSGKSTIISLLERFYNPLTGGIYIDGRNIATWDLGSYRSRLALVSQEPALFQGTIRENILLGSTRPQPHTSEDELIAACKDANIYDFIISLPQGFDTIVGTKGGMLSGGQKQRVAIARALIRDPRVLLLDEATSALDSESEKVVQAALDAAAQGRTTIAVAHRLSTIQRADVIYVLDQGEVVESGTHEALLRRRGRYFELVNLQNLA
ncbi:hypothetical protein CDV55_108019 [Aspergillus turcosus]|nr:hypothetical protein CDV55_108019 [Aspergillus turcosus]